MIRSFCDNETEKIFTREFSRRFSPAIQRTALRKLAMIDAAAELNDLRVPPANHLELLKGNRAGYHSIRINQQWRICFRWQEGNAYDVKIVDYH